MSTARVPYLKLEDLRGGVNDSDAPFSIADNEVVTALNVDYRAGRIGTKRGGCAPISLSGSVFLRDVPVMRQRDQGGFAAASSGTLAITAYGASAADHILIVYVAANTSRTVSAMDLGGVALTKSSGHTNGTFRCEIWYLQNPTIAGGTLTVTLSGAGACYLIAERWSAVDTAATPTTGSSTTGVTSPAQPIFGAGTTPMYMVLNAVAHDGGAATLPTTGIYTSAQGVSTIRLATAAALGLSVKVGFAPKQFSYTIAAVGRWTAENIAILGSSIAAGTRPLRALMRHSPTNIVTADELWAQDDFGRLDRRVSGVWQGGVPMETFQIGSFFTGGYGTNGTSLHGKFFLALDGTTYADRTHVWDGTVLRWAGIVAPTDAPTAVDTGIGAYASTRYFRIRLIEKSGSTILRRSEPSPVLTFTPSGAGTGAVITLASSTFTTNPNNGDSTDWELEASLDNVLFYRMQTITFGTVTATDSTAAATGYSSTGTLSEALTEYNPLPDGRHVVVDEDRVLVGGSHYTTVNDSRVSWSVLTADSGVGNDERVPATSRHFLNLDGLSGGRLTHMMPAVMGGILAFKLSRVYKLNRTGNAAKAYDSQQLTPNRGCFPRGAGDGTDENGVPCVYFTDPNVGAVRFGVNGMQDLMPKRQILVARINKAATVPSRVLFYPKQWLVWIAWALDAGTTPNYLTCYNVRQGAWTDYNGNMATGVSMLLFPDLTTQELRPLLVPSTVGTSGIVEADNGVNDDGTRFRGYVRSKAYTLGQLFREFEINGGMLHAKATSATVQASLIRNLGVETKNAAAVSVAAAGSETYVSVLLDDLVMAECEQVQVEIGDPSTYTGSQLDQTFTLESLVAKYGSGTEGG